jgi:hypothetical protein
MAILLSTGKNPLFVALMFGEKHLKTGEAAPKAFAWDE